MTYANSLSGAFVLDDQSTVVDNQTIRDWTNPASVLVPEANTAIAGRPIVNLSFAINYAVGGIDVRGYHVVNIALHVMCALLVFAAIRRTLELSALPERFGGQGVDVAFATALLWLVHPLNSEVVDYLTERTESLMAFFYLLTLFASVRAAAELPRPEGRARPEGIEGRLPAGGLVADRGRKSRVDGKSVRRWHALAVIACAMGMACKESMVTAPIMVVVYDRIFVFDSFRNAVRVRRGLYAGLAATWIVLLALMSSGPRAAVGGFSTGISIWVWLLNQTRIITHYLSLSFWPRSLVVFYGWPLPLTLGDVAGYALLILLLLAVTAIALLRMPRLGFLGAWFFITLAPTSSIVPIATEVGAERRMYLPLLAVVALAVVAVTSVSRFVANRRSDADQGVRVRVLRGSAAALLGVVAAALAAATVVRNREYESPLRLARTVVDRRPTAVTHHYLAEQLSLASLHDEAIGHLRIAVAQGDSRAGYLLGIELFNAGKVDEAAAQLRTFVQTSNLPYRLVPHWLEPPVSEVLTARLILARAAAMQRRWPEAIEQARLVLTAAPGNREARMSLADSLFASQQYSEAAAQYRTYLAAQPTDVHALTNLGVASIADGKLDDAIAMFRRAVDADPKNATSRRILGMALLDRGDVDAAAAQAREGVALDPNDRALRDLLARTARQRP